jgi:hypothetical protein
MTTPSQDQIDGIAAVLGVLVLLWPFVRSRLTARQVAQVERVAELVVQATEAQMRGKPSASKLTHAVKQAQALSKTYHVKLPDEQWKPLINQAVYQMKQVGGEVPPEVPQAIPLDSLR